MRSLALCHARRARGAGSEADSEYGGRAAGLVKLYGRGWSKRDYYVRQLWNGKGSIDIDNLNASGLSDLSRMCAWSLAHAHARTGDSIAIANYMGGTDEFDQSIASFAVSYAEQNDEDYAIFKKLIKSGELPCA